MTTPEQLATMLQSISIREDKLREHFKPKGIRDHEKRRQQVLERQKAARRDLTRHIRALVQAELQDWENPNEHDNGEVEKIEIDYENMPVRDPQQDDLHTSAETSRAASSTEEIFENKLMIPEPYDLDYIPSDFHTHWLCMPFPAGTRCLVIAANGTTRSILRNGRLIQKFKSWLPGARPNNASQFDCDCSFSSHRRQSDNLRLYFA